MIILDQTTKSLEAKLSGAPATNQLPIVASYVDLTATTYTPGESDTATNSGTAVTALAAPGASTQRQLKSLCVRNRDTASVTLTIQYNNNATIRELWSGVLAVDDTLFYEEGDGFYVLDSTGGRKGAGTGGSYTDEQAQDAVGAMSADTSTVGVTYTDVTPELKWDVLPDGFILRNTRANQPAANSVPTGSLYYVTDENVTERSNGSTWDDVSDVSTGGASAQDRYDALWQKDYFVDNSLLPATNFKNSNATWPAFDFSNVGTNHSLSTDLALERDSTSSAAVGTTANGGWDTGGTRSKLLAVLGGMGFGGVGPAGQLWLWVAQSQPTTTSSSPNSPVHSGYLWIFDSQNHRFIMYRTDSSGGYTALGNYGSSTLIRPPEQADSFPISAALLFDSVATKVMGFARFNGSQWMRILNITDSTYSTMRYCGICASMTGTQTSDAQFLAPVQIWYTA